MASGKRSTLGSTRECTPSAQKIADQIYECFWVQSAETLREYTWEAGRRIDGDLKRCQMPNPKSSTSSIQGSFTFMQHRCDRRAIVNELVVGGGSPSDHG
jgi:hypothetical protein